MTAATWWGEEEKVTEAQLHTAWISEGMWRHSSGPAVPGSCTVYCKWATRMEWRQRYPLGEGNWHHKETSPLTIPKGLTFVKCVISGPQNTFLQVNSTGTFFFFNVKINVAKTNNIGYWGGTSPFGINFYKQNQRDMHFTNIMMRELKSLDKY